jgi:hypothetical protein
MLITEKSFRRPKRYKLDHQDLSWPPKRWPQHKTCPGEKNWRRTPSWIVKKNTTTKPSCDKIKYVQDFFYPFQKRLGDFFAFCHAQHSKQLGTQRGRAARPTPQAVISWFCWLSRTTNGQGAFSRHQEDPQSETWMHVVICKQACKVYHANKVSQNQKESTRGHGFIIRLCWLQLFVETTTRLTV